MSNDQYMERKIIYVENKLVSYFKENYIQVRAT